jgi:DNA repair protein RadC
MTSFTGTMNLAVLKNAVIESKPQEISDTQVLYWARSIIETKFRRSNYLNSPEITKDFLSLVYASETREVFIMIFLDNQNGVLAYQNLFQGTIDGAAIYPREVVKAALEHNASAVILAHNHPSGIAEPSRADKNITEKIVKALGLVEIRVLDHLIVGGVEIVSFAERGLI